MSKTALVADLHFGCRNGSMQFIEYQRRYFEEEFFPYLADNNIKTIFQFGDVFDKRSSIDFRSLYHAKKNFFNVLRDMDISVHMILGNHDLYHLDKLDINSPNLLLSEYKNINIIDKPTTIETGITTIDFIPWIAKSNHDEIMKFIKSSKSDYCVGHFEIAGFEMYKGTKNEGGIDRKLFKKYKNVWSGHYHTRSQIGNIEYIGVPLEITWQDCDDPRGITVFDTNTLTTEFVKNKLSIFKKIEYISLLDQNAFNFDELKDKFVKIIVLENVNKIKYENFLTKVYDAGCYDVSIMENFEVYKQGEVEEHVVIGDTLAVVNSYIDSIEIPGDKNALKKLMNSLYIQTINDNDDD